ncbi:uncharacterized protein LOC129972189 [Argiope bruennichi]|uniref:uncharacterized protein LOC129972189 n=1 Tax=Argiope bruennichi TaxID=94029 RepID=UPI002494725F|nr:uncharacterized protein LOC129972189 [Argiope bruennichi]
MATSSVSPSNPISSNRKAFQNEKPRKNFKIAFVGKAGSGRNSLAWRMNNLNDSELPVLPSLPCREVVLEASTRSAIKHQGEVCLQIRIVPPEDQGYERPFFHRHGGINEIDVVVFVVDLGDETSSDEFYTWYEKVRRYSGRHMPPFLIVGNKTDLRLFGRATPYTWGENMASVYSAREYLECSAKTNYRVGDVLDAILKILL